MNPIPGRHPASDRSADSPHSPPSGGGPDGADTGQAWGPSYALLGIALGLLAGALAWWWWQGTAERAAPAPQVGGSALASGQQLALAPEPTVRPAEAPMSNGPKANAPAAAAAPQTSPPPAPAREVDGDLTPTLADYLNPGEKPSMAEVIDRLHQAGVHSGLGAFSPPGTRPPLVGLAVPEDFALPPGYVRHYQATDDGQRIEPILMFAPDHRLVDAAGRPVPLPADRVVPPSMAPQGLPLRDIVIPAPADKPGN